MEGKSLSSMNTRLLYGGSFSLFLPPSPPFFLFCPRLPLDYLGYYF